MSHWQVTCAHLKDPQFSVSVLLFAGVPELISSEFGLIQSSAFSGAFS